MTYDDDRYIRDALWHLDQITLDLGTDAKATAVRTARTALRAINRTSSPSMTTGTHDSLFKLAEDIEDVGSLLSRSWAKRLRTLIGTDGGPVPASVPTVEVEIVPGDKLGDLPKGTLIVKCNTDGVPNPMYLPVKVGSNFDHRDRGPSERYRVLYRVPEEPVKVGDEIKGKRAMTLPTRSIVMGIGNARFEGWPLTLHNGKYRSGVGSLSDITLTDGMYRVLHLGAES